MLLVLGLIRESHHYPGDIGFGGEIQSCVGKLEKQKYNSLKPESGVKTTISGLEPPQFVDLFEYVAGQVL